MTDLGVHDADLRVHDDRSKCSPCRSGRSRCADLSVHDGPLPALETRDNVLSVLKSHYPHVQAVSGNVEEGTSFSSGYFDRVVVVHVLEHLCNLPKALDEIRRLLAPAGVLSVVAPCEGGLAYALARRLSAQRMFEKTYQTPYRWFIEREHVNTYDEIRTELTARFRITDERRWPLPGLPIDVNLAVGLTLVPK